MTRCNRIRAWLEEHPGAGSLSADLASHQGECDACRDDWAFHARVIASLRNLEPTAPEIQRLRARVDQRLEAEAGLPGSASVQSLPLADLVRRSLRVLGAVGAFGLLIIALRAGWNLPAGREPSRAVEPRRQLLLTISAFQGDVRLSRGDDLRSLEARGIGVPVFEGDGVRLAGTSEIALNAGSGTQLRLAGNGAFVFRPAMLDVAVGQGTIGVRLAGGKFQVAFPQTVLEIHGTEINFRIATETEEIRLVEGAAGYRLRNGRYAGRLVPGQTLVVRHGLASVSMNLSGESATPAKELVLSQEPGPSSKPVASFPAADPAAAPAVPGSSAHSEPASGLSSGLSSESAVTTGLRRIDDGF